MGSPIVKRNAAKLLNKKNLKPSIGHLSGAYDRLLLIWGGYYEAEYRTPVFHDPSKLLVYDTDADKWLSFPTTGACPQSNSGCCGVVVGNYWYICGGFFRRPLHAGLQLYRLNLKSLHWEWIKPADKRYPLRRDKFVGWEYQHGLYFFGGYGDHPDFIENTVVEEGSSLFFDRASFGEDEFQITSWNNEVICFDMEQQRWSQVKTKGQMPCPRAAHTACKTSQNVLLVFGGRFKDGRLDDLFMLDLQGMKWTKITFDNGPKPTGRSWHVMDALDDSRLVLFGGFTSNCRLLNDLWILDLNRLHWSEICNYKMADTQSELPSLLWHSGRVIDSVFYIFGGTKSNILNIHETQVYSNQLLSIRFSPASLMKICISCLAHRKNVALERHLPESLSSKASFALGIHKYDFVSLVDLFSL